MRRPFCRDVPMPSFRLRLSKMWGLPGNTRICKSSRAWLILSMSSLLRTRRGIIFILSAPSGAGKTTLSRGALTMSLGLQASVSVTTRMPRPGECDGIDYSFVTDEEFRRKLAVGELAEWAQVFDASYGTPREPLDSAIASGTDILLDIDIQGARQLRQLYAGDAVTIFVLPPSFTELEERLRRRGTESEAAIERRLMRAREEASAFPEYDYLVINSDLAESLAQLEAVVKAERLRVARLGPEFAAWNK
ncbi:MAG TPA: guanylate kinase [Candidatus Binataceae bacterium]|nr:guanylate kinase [Candidatus Binataceae bacterium]